MNDDFPIADGFLLQLPVYAIVKNPQRLADGTITRDGTLTTKTRAGETGIPIFTDDDLLDRFVRVRQLGVVQAFALADPPSVVQFLTEEKSFGADCIIVDPPESHRGSRIIIIPIDDVIEWLSSV
jgi:hypothetical protein